MASGEALFNPYLPEFHADPYPFYHRLRAERVVLVIEVERARYAVLPFTHTPA